MADAADKGSVYMQRELEGQIARVRSEAAGANEGPRECEDCGEPIPDARRRAMPGCTRCIRCQEKFEQGM